MVDERRSPSMLELVARLQSGDMLARDTIALMHRALLIRCANGIHARRPWIEPEELVAEGWLAMLEALPRYRGLHGASVTTYLQMTIRRHLRDYLQRFPSLPQEPLSLPGQPSPLDAIPAPVVKPFDWSDQIQQLPARWRQVLILHYGLDGERPLSLRRIARRLGVSSQRVSQIREQAIKRLRRFFT